MRLRSCFVLIRFKATSSIAFPSSNNAVEAQVPHYKLHPPPRPPHLPFRRISLPTQPSLVHRESVVSVASFDSLPEEDSASPSSSVTSLKPNRPSMRNAVSTNNLGGGAQLNKRQKRTSMTAKRNRSVTRVTADEAMEEKRRKVINEFYATERAYVDGLELIYSVSITLQHRQRALPQY